MIRYINADEELLYDRALPRDQYGFLIKDKRGRRNKISIFSFDESNIALKDGSLISLKEIEKSDTLRLNRQGGLTVMTAGGYFVQIIVQSTYMLSGTSRGLLDLHKEEKETSLEHSAVILSTATVRAKEETTSGTGFFQANKGESLALRISSIVDGYSFALLKGVVKIIKFN